MRPDGAQQRRVPLAVLPRVPEEPVRAVHRGVVGVVVDGGVRGEVGTLGHRGDPTARPPGSGSGSGTSVRGAGAARERSTHRTSGKGDAQVCEVDREAGAGEEAPVLGGAPDRDVLRELLTVGTPNGSEDAGPLLPSTTGEQSTMTLPLIPVHPWTTGIPSMETYSLMQSSILSNNGVVKGIVTVSENGSVNGSGTFGSKAITQSNALLYVGNSPGFQKHNNLTLNNGSRARFLSGRNHSRYVVQSRFRNLFQSFRDQFPCG